MTEVTRTDLMPGVHLRAVHTKKFKSSYLSVTLMTPLSAETAAENALIPYVLRRGSQAQPDMESLSAALDELYGGAIEPAVRKKGETQCVGFAASFLDDAYTLDDTPILERACDLLGELLLRPLTQDGVFSPAYVEGEKANLIDRIRGQINDKRTYSVNRMTALMCPEEAYGVDKLGDEHHAAAITAKSLWARYQRLLARSEVEVYYCGSAGPERAERALKAALTGLPRGDELDALDCEVRLTAWEEPRVVEEVMDVTQGKLAMGFRTGGATVWEVDYPALMMFNAVYGGTSMSKLFMNVREKLSLCYFASSAIERMKGVLWVSSGIEFDKYEQSRDEILAQLEAVRRGEVEPWELEGARRIIVTGLRSTLDAQHRQEDYWLGQAAAGLDEGPEALSRRVEAVTPEQVVEVSKKLRLDTIYFLKGRED